MDRKALSYLNIFLIIGITKNLEMPSFQDYKGIFVIYGIMLQEKNQHKNENYLTCLYKIII